MELETKIKTALESIRPGLQADGGDLQFVDFDPQSGILQIKFQGMCMGCPMAALTLKQVIESEVQAEVPEVLEVTAV